jgi:4-alpha-glucanotransferase
MDPEGREPAATDAAGVETRHVDGFGHPCTPSSTAVASLHEAMGLAPGEAPPHPGALVVTPQNPRPPVPGGSTVVLENGTELALAGGTGGDTAVALPDGLPVGYHRLVGTDGSERALLVSPGRCHLPSTLRTWGVTAQLYAARGAASWGIGDLHDLGTLLTWARGRGAGLVGLHPLHAPTPTADPPDSPYSPSTRRRHDPLLIALDDVPGFAELPDADRRRAAGRALSRSGPSGDPARDPAEGPGAGPIIDRAASWRAKRDALEAVWATVRERPDPDFDRFLAAGGDGLHRWGTFCAIADQAEREGRSTAWPTWPAELRRPEGAAVARRAAQQPDRVRFWCWLQWLVDRQLRAAGADRLVLNDLAVGFAADGFDAWEWQDLVAAGVRIGAPPDPLGRDGQDWGLPPFVPWRLSAAGYRPLVETVRAAFTHARGLRVDHVMGLFRLYWIPPAADAGHGAYVRFAHHDLLHVLAIESTRAGALVVGEDLGTVEPGVRDVLGAAGVLSTRLLWFEDEPPARWPHQAMAAITTHDLPTVAGVWTGVDLADLRRAGVTVPPDGDDDFRHRLRMAASAPDHAPVDDVVVAAYRTVAAGPSVVATAALDDLTGARHRPNVPGTIDQHPNWRIPLPVSIDALDGHPLAEAVATALSETR